MPANDVMTDISSGVSAGAAVLQLIPSLISAIQSVEAMFGAGQGAAKKAAVMSGLASQPAAVQAAASPAVDGLAAIFTGKPAASAPVAPAAPVYVPVYSPDGTITFPGPGGSVVNVAARYCLTPDSAAAFVSYLNGTGKLPVVSTYMDHPFVGMSAGGLVPWLQFGVDNGCIKVNAGIMADYFNHEESVTYALGELVADVQDRFGEAGLSWPLSVS